MQYTYTYYLYLLTFDIPEEKEGKREYFRRRLKKLGFYHFQRSVFIIPYPCEKEIEEVAAILEISLNIHILIAQRFEGDEELIRRFNLKEKAS